MDVTRVELLMRRLAVVSTGWKTISSAIPADPILSQIFESYPSSHCAYIPEPNSLAVPDSLLYSFTPEPRTGAMAGGDIALSAHR